MSTQAGHARRLLELHQAPPTLVLLNAWDVASARVFERAGAAAIGTTSMGIAAAEGFPDGERIDLGQMLERVARIVDAVDVPVTADLETGYADDPAGVARSVGRALDSGIAGINLEDGTGDRDAPLLDTEAMAERVAAARRRSADAGVPLVINARTDVYLAAAGRPEQRLENALARGRRYREAGADCVFVPGGLDRTTIAALVAGLGAPLNVVANPAISTPVVPPVAELEALGVARVSVGSGLMRAALGYVDRAAREVLESGTYAAMAEELKPERALKAYLAATGHPIDNG